MEIQLIFNEKMVKDLLPVSANLAGEYIGAAMFEAQEIGLKQILGSRLLRALKQHEKAQDWADFPAYEDLKDECALYLVYQTIVELLPKVAYKIANIGVVETNDTNVTNVRKEDRDSLVDEYQAKADHFCYELQRWLLDNRAAFAELTDCQCNEIHGNLTSMASCGIWLGGARGFKGGC